MRVGISLLNLRLGKMGGIETYMRKLVEYFPQLPDAKPIFFVNREIQELVPKEVDQQLLDWSEFKTTGFRLMEAFLPYHCRAAEKAVCSSGIDVMLFPHQAMFPMKVSVPSVLTVVDVQHLYIPDYFSRFDIEFRKRAYMNSLKECTKIAAISGVTGDSLVDKCGVAPDKIEVVHLGCDEINLEAVKEQNLVSAPYFFFPAASFPHKGHHRLFRSYAALKRSGKVSEKLVLTGMKTAHWKMLAALIKDEGMQQDILHLGFVSYQQVLGLYKGASAVLFPTEFEGFGIPIIEATQFSKKVVCSKLAVFDELGVPPEWQIDYSKSEELLAAVSKPHSTRLTRQPNTWKDTMAQTFDLLKRTADNG